MNYTYFTVGPTQTYPTVSAHIKQALQEDILSISHRSKQFEAIFQDTTDALRKLLNIPNTHTVFFVSSSLESMERIIENCVEKSCFYFVNGAFSQKFYSIAVQLKKKAEKIEVPFGQGFDFSSVEIPQDAELIGITQNDTATGVQLDMDDISKIKQHYPDKFVAVDVVSSVPYTSIGFNTIDCAFFSAQKGFCMQAGLGVLIVSEKALQKAKALQERGASIGTYHSFISLNEKAEKHQTPETPNVLAIYTLGKVCHDMLEKGIEVIQEETEQKADLIYSFLDTSSIYDAFVKDPTLRSKTTIVVSIPGKAKKTIAYLKEQGYIVGSGYGKNKEDHIRIANFPSHTIDQIKQLLYYLKKANG